MGKRRYVTGILLVLCASGLVFSAAEDAAESRREEDSYRQALDRPDCIEIRDGAASCILEPDTEAYEEIHSKVAACWEENVDGGAPARVMWTHLPEKPEGALEVTYHYEEPVRWRKGEDCLEADTYTFFPLETGSDASDVLLVSRDKNYETEAVVVTFPISGELEQVFMKGWKGISPCDRLEP